MKQQLIQYVNLLFAGTAGSEEIKQEILMNTLDRYDDLIAQGKSPEAAYRLAISGIGDIHELLEMPVPSTPAPHVSSESDKKQESENKLRRAVAIAFYIISPIPLFILGGLGNGSVGLALLLLLVAAATVLMVTSKGKSSPSAQENYTKQHSRDPLRSSIAAIIWALALLVYIALSFTTHAWYITWLIFPIAACIQGLVVACIDLKEATKHEK